MWYTCIFLCIHENIFKIQIDKLLSFILEFHLSDIFIVFEYSNTFQVLLVEITVFSWQVQSDLASTMYYWWFVYLHIFGYVSTILKMLSPCSNSMIS